MFKFRRVSDFIAVQKDVYLSHGMCRTSSSTDAMYPTACSEQDSEPGARLTCRILLHLFKTPQRNPFPQEVVKSGSEQNTRSFTTVSKLWIFYRIV